MVWRVGLLMAVAGAVAAGAQTTKSMAKDAHPSFEVAAIRLSDPDSHRQGISADGHRMTLHGQTIKSMMMFAYGVHGRQIVGVPESMTPIRYDVEGVVDTPGEPDTPQMQELLQKLLKDRFGLKLHRDKQEMAYYAIAVGKGGPKMAKAADPDAQPDNDGNGRGGAMEMRFKSHTMAHFALAMQYFMDRPMIDETGLTGRYDFTLKWTPGDATVGEGNGPPGIFTAVQEQLGLKFEAKKGPVEVLVVDGLVRPSEN